jgi:HEAT repeat protein
MLFRGFRLLTWAACLSFLALSQNEDAFDTNQRVQRIRDLGKKDARAIPALEQYLTDPNRDIRVEAVKAIIKIGTEASLAPLTKATHDSDAEVQIRATDGIVNYYVPGYVVKGGLTGSFTRGVRQARAFLSPRNDQRIDVDVTIRPDVAQALADEVRSGAGADVRANAARAAGILRDRAAVPALAQALHAKESQLIFESLVALQKIGDPSACEALSSPAHDLDERIQVTALETIGVLHCLERAPDVRSSVTNARNTKIRRAALQALAMLAIPDDRPIFQKYVGDRDADLRASALEGLGRIREPEDTPTIAQAYDETNADPEVHLAAAFALVDEGKVDVSDFSPLLYLFESLEIKARAFIATAYLTELARREDVRRALFTLLPRATKDQKIALCSIFAASRSEDVIPMLNTLAKDIDPDVALAASRALRVMQSGQRSQSELLPQK